MANPIKILENSLEPTKGVNSSTYSFFNSILGLFDLAGQENKNWLSKDKDLFNESSVIICIFDITNSLELIIPFLIKIIKLKEELNLQNCNVVVFLHKIDVVSSSYINLKVNSIKIFLEAQFSEGRNVKIYTTSIARDFFFQTYNIILDILTIIFQKEIIPIDITESQNLKIDLAIVLKCDSLTPYRKHDLSRKFNFSDQEVKFHLERLKHLRFVSNFMDDPTLFQLTKRANYFKLGLERKIGKKAEDGIEKGIELCYIFLNLTEKPINM